MKRISPSMKFALALSSVNTQCIRQLECGLNLHGISFSELLVMHALHDAPDMTMRRIELARQVGLSASGVTRMLKPMEKIGLVEKEQNARDARVSLVKLSEGGQRIYRESFASSEQAAQSFTEELSASQLTQLLGLLERLK